MQTPGQPNPALMQLPEFMVSINGKPLDPFMLADYEHNEMRTYHERIAKRQLSQRSANAIPKRSTTKLSTLAALNSDNHNNPLALVRGHRSGLPSATHSLLFQDSSSSSMHDIMYGGGAAGSTSMSNQGNEGDYDLNAYNQEERDYDVEDEEELRQWEFECTDEIEREQCRWTEEDTGIEHDVYEQVQVERYTRPPYLSQVRSPLFTRPYSLEQHFNIPIDIESYRHWGSSDPITISIWRLNYDEEQWDALYHAQLPSDFTTLLWAPDECARPKWRRFDHEHPLLIDFEAHMHGNYAPYDSQTQGYDFEAMKAVNTQIRSISLTKVTFPHPDRFANVMCVPEDYYKEPHQREQTLELGAMIHHQQQHPFANNSQAPPQHQQQHIVDGMRRLKIY